MSKPYDSATHRGDNEAELPVELLDLHRRLLRDSAAWQGAVPGNERLNARIRTLPLEMPREERAAEPPSAPDVGRMRLPWERERRAPQEPVGGPVGRAAMPG